MRKTLTVRSAWCLSLHFVSFIWCLFSWNRHGFSEGKKYPFEKMLRRFYSYKGMIFFFLPKKLIYIHLCNCLIIFCGISLLEVECFNLKHSNSNFDFFFYKSHEVAFRRLHPLCQACEIYFIAKLIGWKQKFHFTFASNIQFPDNSHFVWYAG